MMCHEPCQGGARRRFDHQHVLGSLATGAFKDVRQSRVTINTVLFPSQLPGQISRAAGGWARSADITLNEPSPRRSSITRIALSAS